MHTGTHRRADTRTVCQTSKADWRSSCTCGPDDVALRSTNFLITGPVSPIISRWCAPIHPGSVEVTHLCVKIKSVFLSWWWLLLGWSTGSCLAFLVPFLGGGTKQANKRGSGQRGLTCFERCENLNFGIVIARRRRTIWEADIVISLMRSLGKFWIV